MKEFGKTICKIAIPVTLQSMLQSSFSIVDQLMIGQLGENSIAAVGLVGNFMLIFSVVMGAIGTVAGILVSQFLGAGDEKEAWGGFTVSNVLGFIIAGIFTLTCLLGSGAILGLYTSDAATIEAGAPYFRIVAFTFIPMAINTILATWLRCNEHAMIPLLAGVVAVISNTGLNYIMIFGHLGIDAMGVRGAGYATLAAQVLNLAFTLTGFAVCLKKDHMKMQLSMKMQKVSLKDYLIMIAPIIVSEFLWSLGQNVNSAVYGRIGTDSLAAYTLTAPIQGLFCGALSGLSAAAGIIIGKELGKKDYDQAYGDSKKLLKLGLVGALLLSVILILLSPVYASLYNVAQEVRDVTRLLLIVFAAYAPVKVLNMILGGGIIKSGGDTKTVMLIDTFGTWGVGIPLCLFAAYVLHLSIVPVYAILSVEEVVRLGISMVVFARKSWMKSLDTEG